jgi:hypothetical protein
MAFPARLRNSLALSLLAAGCGSSPPAPQWQGDAAQAMAAFQRAYLAGETARAEAEFRAARKELASTGRADLVARAELVRCATRSASLEFDDCPGFVSLQDATPDNVRYAEYLLGKSSHRGADEPLSRLVAESVRFRSGGIDPAGISRAVEIASAQGWRRPLLAWLGVQLKRAEAAGDHETAERIRRRMALVSG